MTVQNEIRVNNVQDNAYVQSQAPCAKKDA